MHGRWRNLENTQSEKAIVGSDSALLTRDSEVASRTQEQTGGLVLASFYPFRVILAGELKTCMGV